MLKYARSRNILVNCRRFVSCQVIPGRQLANSPNVLPQRKRIMWMPVKIVLACIVRDTWEPSFMLQADISASFAVARISLVDKQRTINRLAEQWEHQEQGLSSPSTDRPPLANHHLIVLTGLYVEHSTGHRAAPSRAQSPGVMADHHRLRRQHHRSPVLPSRRRRRRSKRRSQGIQQQPVLPCKG